MSTTVDSRVVEMRFDNRHFENNVSTTMSTLDKLKAKLGFEGATKGLENVNSAAKNVNMNGLGSAVETVQAKFSALDVMAVTALSNITNSAVNAGKRIVSALTIDPVKTGFNEYEMKMDSVKTIVNSTGRDLADVNKLLEELNEYSDQTIYSFKDMTSNIGKFTNAGVKLEDAVLAIKGISNEAAVSGASAAEASRAMYNFSQALSSGYVKLIDWKSIENANMATKEFKQQLIDTAVELGVLTQEEDMYTTSSGKAFNATQNFNDCLQEQWMTNDVLIKTLGKYADANTDIGKKAFAAAQEVAKMTQMWDVLKETAQSGWARTWEIIVGDLNTAKKIFTPLTNFFSKIIDTMSDWRNRILQIALDFTAPWQTMVKKIGNIIEAAGSIGSKIAKVTGSLSDFQDIVNKVWRGDFNNWGDNPDRRDLLSEAGWDYRVVQELVNKGYQYKLTIEDVEAAHKKFGLTLEDNTDALGDNADGTKTVLDYMNDLTEARLKEAGFTEEEIKLYRALQKEADRLGISVAELGEEMANTKGRDLLVESFKNFGGMFVDLGKAAKSAWISVFNPPGAEVLGIRLYGIIRSLRDFTKSLRMVDEETGELTITGQKFQRVFQGIFSAIHIVLTVVGGPLKIAFKILTQLLSVFGVGLLDVAAFLGDVITKFDKWLSRVLDFTGVFEKLVNPIKNAIASFKEWIATLRKSENLPQDIAKGIANGFSKAFETIKDFFKNIPKYFKNGFDGISESPLGGFIAALKRGLKIAGQTVVELGRIILAKINEFLSARGFGTISEDSIAGLIQGFKDGTSKVWKAAVSMVTTLVNKVKEFLGIHSPSKVFIAIGGFITTGLVLGLKNGFPAAYATVKDLFGKLLDRIKEMDIGAVVTSIMGLGLVRGFNKIADGIAGFGAIGEAVADVLVGVRKVLNSFTGLLRSIAFENYANGIKSLAIGLAILVGALVVLAYVCGKDNFNIWEAVGVISVLAVVLGILAGALALINKSSMSIGKDGIQVNNITNSLMSIGVVLLLMAMAVKTIGKLDPAEVKTGFAGLVGMILGLIAVLAVCRLLTIADFGNGMDAAGGAILRIAIALLILVTVAKKLAKMSGTDMGKAAIGLLGLVGIITLLMWATKLVGANADKIGSSILKISIAMGALVIVARMLAKMSWEDMGRAAVGMLGLVGIVSALMLATRLAGDPGKIGATLLGVSVAMGVMTLVMKVISKMSLDEIIKGLFVIEVFALIILGLVVATKGKEGQVFAAAGTIMGVAMAIGILALVSTLFGLVKIETLAKGVIAVGILSNFMTKMIKACRNVPEKITGTLVTLTVAIAVMAGAVALLSLIDPARLAIATGAMSALMGLFALLMYTTKFISSGAGTFKKLMGALGPLLIVIGVLGGILIAMSLLKVDSSSLANAGGIAILLLTLTGVLYALSGLDMTLIDASKMNKIVKTMLTLSLVLVAFGLVLAMMSAINVTNAIPNAIALSILAGMMTLLITPLSAIGNKAKEAAKGALALAVMAVPLFAFVLVLKKMSGVDDALDKVKALIILSAAMTVLVAALALIGHFAGAGAIAGVIALTLMAIPLNQFVKVIKKMDGVENAKDNVLALVTLTAAMALLLVPLALIGSFAFGGAIAGVLALTAMAIPMNAFIKVLDKMSGIQNGIANAKALTELMTAIGDVLFKISLVAPLAILGVGALTAMLGLMTALGVFATAIGKLITVFPELQTFLDKGIDLLVNLAQGLGRIIGAFLAAIAGEVMTLIPLLGMCISMFMINAQPFITIAKTIDDKVMTGVGILAKAILALIGTEFLAGIASLFGVNLPLLGAQLALFAANVLPFVTTAMTITPDMLTGVQALADTILILTAAGVMNGISRLLNFGSSPLITFATQLPLLGQGLAGFSKALGSLSADQLNLVNDAAQAVKNLALVANEIPNSGGFVGLIVGNNDLAAFANQFPDLGWGLGKFIKKIGTFTDAEATTVNCASQAVKNLALAASGIPNSGGFVGLIVGNNDLALFAVQFPLLGWGLRQFIDKIGTFTETEVNTVNCASTAIQKLATAAATIPNSGGFVGLIVGNNDLGKFANDFPLLGDGLRQFIDKIGTFTETEVNTVNCAVNAVQSLATVAATLPNSGGFVGLIVGNNDLGKFANEFPKLGEGLKDFVDKIGTFSAAQVDSVNAAVKAVNALSGLANANLSGARKNLEGFSNKLPKFGTDIKTFCDNMPGSDSVDAVVGNINKILTLAQNIANTKTGAFANFANDLNQVGVDAVNRFVDAFTSDAAKTDITNAAKKLADAVIDGFESKEADVKAAGKALAQDAIDGVRDKYDSMKSAGKYLVDGFAAGIDAKSYSAAAKAKAMAEAAINAAKKLLKINSPSKVFRAIGYSIPEGLAAGIDKMGYMVADSSIGMAGTALDNVRRSISNISDLVNADIDSQPTIRPVMDLSDVKTGTAALNDMLGMNSSVGVNAHVGSISSMMNRRSQNGANDDVVSAIDKLNKRMDNLGNTTYQINGITYDDGSNVTDAIATLVRAAKIERRV